MKVLGTIAYSLLGRLKMSGPVRRLKKSLKRPVIVLTPGEDRRRFLERAGKYSSVAEVITPGFRVLLEANGQQYELYTDSQGTTIRES